MGAVSISTVVLGVLAALLVLGASSADAVHLSDTKLSIYGGAKQENGDLRFMVDVIWTRESFDAKHHGAAVQIAPNWVLGTKVVTTDGLVTGVHLEFGKAKGGKGVRVKVDKRVEHPTADLVLLKLKTTVQLDDLHWPVNLPYPGKDFTNETVTLVGWTNDGKELNTGDVKVLDPNECEKLGVTGDGLLCTADELISTCDTDDGTPLVQNLLNGLFRLVGVATATSGSKCPAQSGATVRKFVKIADYTDWIVETVKA